MDRKAHIAELLSSLGNTDSVVRDSLVHKRISGIRSHCRSCPIANYLVREGIMAVEVSTGGLGRHPEIQIAEGFGPVFIFPLDKYPNLQGVFDFIRGFDGGHFPSCIKGV